MSELDRDPDFFAQDILFAVMDMAENKNFTREQFIEAVQMAVNIHGLEVVDLRQEEFRNAA